MVPLFLCLGAPAAAQELRECGLELRGGVRYVASAPLVAQGSPLGEVERGATIALGGSCRLSPRWGIGLASEAQLGRNITFVHLLATPELTISSARSGRTVLSLAGAVGWTLTGTGAWGVKILLLPSAGQRALDPGTSGPTLGASARLRTALFGAVSLVVDAGWRVAFVEETIFGNPERSEGSAVHLVQVTAGFRLRP